MRPVTLRNDPAPSRWSYRMQRLMLTPMFRLGLRVGVPFAVALAGSLFWLSDEGRRATLTSAVTDLRSEIEQRPEFTVRLMAIDGASDVLAETIRASTKINFPISSFDLELAQLREQVEAIAAVDSASARIRPGGILQVTVRERAPAMLWRTRTDIKVLDADGVIIATAPSRLSRADLPLVAGDGAGENVQEALELVRAAGPLAPRLRGLVRVGERRWDVVMDRDQRILLPVDKPVQALERVIALNQMQDLLRRDLAIVDMRIGSRPTIRMNNPDADELLKTGTPEAGIIKTIGIGEDDR